MAVVVRGCLIVPLLGVELLSSYLAAVVSVIDVKLPVSDNRMRVFVDG
jgi:hypothetical protein